MRFSYLKATKSRSGKSNRTADVLVLSTPEEIAAGLLIRIVTHEKKKPRSSCTIVGVGYEPQTTVSVILDICICVSDIGLRLSVIIGQVLVIRATHTARNELEFPLDERHKRRLGFSWRQGNRPVHVSMPNRLHVPPQHHQTAGVVAI